jgi:hypothetical protein
MDGILEGGGGGDAGLMKATDPSFRSPGLGCLGLELKGGSHLRSIVQLSEEAPGLDGLALLHQDAEDGSGHHRRHPSLADILDNPRSVDGFHRLAPAGGGGAHRQGFQREPGQTPRRRQGKPCGDEDADTSEGDPYRGVFGSLRHGVSGAVTC